VNWLSIAILFSVIYIFYSLQQIKMILKEKGYAVDIFSNPFEDYKNFKMLVAREKETTLKARYQGILNGLHMSLIGTVVIAVYLIYGRKP